MGIFEIVAVTLTLKNIFYLLNFSYIWTALAIGIYLYIHKVKYSIKREIGTECMYEMY